MQQPSTDQRVASEYAARHAGHRPPFERMTLADAIAVFGDDGVTIDPAVAAAIDEELAAQRAYLVTTAEKVDDGYVFADVEDNDSAGCAAAIVWAVREVAGNPRVFDYVKEMATASMGRGLAAGQIRGLFNCLRADAQREARRVLDLIGDAAPFGDDEPVIVAAPAPVAPAAPAGLDLRGVPSGLYMVPGGSTELRVRVDNLTRDAGNRWAGWVFVKDGNPYGRGARYGAQRPGASAYSGAIEDALRVIAADPVEAMREYGRRTGTCGRCGRPLTDEASKAAGIGPVCDGLLERGA